MGSSFLERTLAQGRELYDSKMQTDLVDHTTIQLEELSLGLLDEAMVDPPMEEVASQAADHVISQRAAAMADPLLRNTAAFGSTPLGPAHD
uniref:Uncharacterized protein n=1 Tax=Cannabis sativa TaxID=3483 RepID=A0A803P9B5_CANSA